MTKTKEVTKTYGKMGGVNYFIIPRMTRYSILYGYKYPKDEFEKFSEEEFDGVLTTFKETFSNLKNQTIHIFAYIDWVCLEKLITYTTPTQFQFLHDYENSEVCKELRNFHNIQTFIRYLYTIEDFMKNNRIIFHCNRFLRKYPRNIYKYIFNCVESGAEFYNWSGNTFDNLKGCNRIKLECHFLKFNPCYISLSKNVCLKVFYKPNMKKGVHEVKIERIIEE